MTGTATDTSAQLERSVRHDTFVLERDYPATTARVWAAFADPVSKAAWFGGDDAPSDHNEFDFRVGGREVNAGTHHGGTFRFDARYFDLVEESRIVYAYDMYVEDVKLSTSLTTIELRATDGGTHLTFTEHGAFYDGHEEPGLRQSGTEELLDAIGAALGAIRS